MEGLLQIIAAAVMLIFSALFILSIAAILRDILSEKKKDESDKIGHIDSAELSGIIERTARALADARGNEIKMQNAEFRMQNDMSEVDEHCEIEDAVIFSRRSIDMDERYATLSAEHQGFFDEIISHAMSKDGAREHRFSGYYDYKIGSYRLLRITVKRGEIVCELKFLDRRVLDYLTASEVKIKQSASTIRVTEPAAVCAVKDGVDLLYTQIAEDREYKKALARERRREKRKKELVRV